MNYFIAESGELTISVNESGDAYNLDYDLTLKAEGSAYETIKLKGSVADICVDMIDMSQALNETRDDKRSAQKQIQNGVLVIEAGGKTYNAQGVEIK